jgi:hypothetical protein
VIHSNFSARAVSLLVFIPFMLTGLRAQDKQDKMVPLKNWATPLYWHPNQVEKVAAAKNSSRGATAQLQFSQNAVSTDALTFVAITPCRLVDTRGSVGGFNGDMPFSGPSLTSGMTQTFPVQLASEAMDDTAPAPCGMIPSIAEAYSFNVTVIPHGGGVVDYVTIWPAGSTQPVVSLLNDLQGGIVANAAIVPAGTTVTSGGVSVYNSGPAVTDIIIDVNGFYAAPTDQFGNTAIGAGSLALNDGGQQNTATGASALASNTTGGDNTATGSAALQNNSTGTGNTAIGTQTLVDNTTGGNNTACGAYSLLHNSTGANNTGFGSATLFSNTTGGYNTASGTGALQNNTVGTYNVGFGTNTLLLNTTGSNNIALGYQAGSAAPVGNSHSIYLGSVGTSMDASGSIQIGTQGTQTAGTIIAGIYEGTPIAGNSPSPVCVDSTGLLSNGNNGMGCPLTTPSSIRFKEQVADMGDSSDKLFQLRPVTFVYKPRYDDGSHTVQYGLIAEEVAKLYPEMVAYDKNGQPSAIKYQALAPMLLNEVQKQHSQVEKLNVEVATQNELAQQQDETIRQLQARLAAVEALLNKVQPAAAAPVQ